MKKTSGQSVGRRVWQGHQASVGRQGALSIRRGVEVPVNAVEIDEIERHLKYNAQCYNHGLYWAHFIVAASGSTEDWSSKAFRKQYVVLLSVPLQDLCRRFEQDPAPDYSMKPQAAAAIQCINGVAPKPRQKSSDSFASLTGLVKSKKA